MNEVIETGKAAEEHALADAKAIKDMLVAAGYHVGKCLTNGPKLLPIDDNGNFDYTGTKRALCVYLERGAQDPLAKVLQMVIEESLDVEDKESVIDAIHHITDLLGNPEYTAKRNASAMVMFWRNIPWTE